MMRQVLSISEYQALVGKEIGVSDWLTIDQGRVDHFANVTEDHQFIHVDPRSASRTPFGGTIAHGYLTLSLLTKFSSEVMPGLDGTQMGINYGLNRVRFLTPVKVGQTIRARFRLADLQQRHPGQFLMTTEVVVEIDGEEKPALIAEWLSLAFVSQD